MVEGYSSCRKESERGLTSNIPGFFVDNMIFKRVIVHLFAHGYRK